MPYRTFDHNEVARYLHLSREEVEQLVKNQEIPFEKHGNRLVFRKVAIDGWASKRILGLDSKRLVDYHQKTTQSAQERVTHTALLPERLLPDFVHPSLPAKTKASVLREMTLLAGKTGRVSDPEALLSGLRAREEICSTGVPGGLAVLHTTHSDQYIFESPLIVLGRTVQEIPFGSPDGGPTDLFFLIGSPEDKMHLHILARLCVMAQKTELLTELRHAPSGEAMYEAMMAAEVAVLNDQYPRSHST